MWPSKEKPTSCVKMVVSLFSGILFSETLKLSRNHPEVLKLKTEVARKVILKKKKYTKFWKIFITLILGVIQFWCQSLQLKFIVIISSYYGLWFIRFWGSQVENFILKKSLPNSKELKLSPYITEKITAPNYYTVTFTQNYLQVLLKVTFSSFPSNNIVKTKYKWKNPLTFQFGGRNGTSNFESSYLENLFSDLRLVSSWTVTYIYSKFGF